MPDQTQEQIMPVRQAMKKLAKSMVPGDYELCLLEDFFSSAFDAVFALGALVIRWLMFVTLPLSFWLIWPFFRLDQHRRHKASLAAHERAMKLYSKLSSRESQ